MSKVNRRFRVLLIICGLSGLIALPLVTSYTHVTIANSASVRITDTKNALIAVDLQNDVCFRGDTVKGIVTNNLGVPLTSLSATEGASVPSGLDAGAEAILAIRADKSGLYSGEIQAHWHNGRATIPYSVHIVAIDLDSFATWDKNSQEICVANSSGYGLTIIVGGRSVELAPHETINFDPTGDTTEIIFCLGAGRIERIHTVLLDTPPESITETPEKGDPNETTKAKPAVEPTTAANMELELIPEPIPCERPEPIPELISENTENTGTKREAIIAP